MKIHFLPDYGRKKVKTVWAVAVCLFLCLLLSSFHPYYVSLTEIKYKADEKTMQISCRTFSDNMEDALRKYTSEPVNMLHPKDKKAIETLLETYLNKHLMLKINGKNRAAVLLGYEKEEGSIWSYLEIKGVEIPTSLSIENTLLYENLPEQMNIMQVEINGKKQNGKLNKPEKEFVFHF